MTSHAVNGLNLYTINITIFFSNNRQEKPEILENQNIRAHNKRYILLWYVRGVNSDRYYEIAENVT